MHLAYDINHYHDTYDVTPATRVLFYTEHSSFKLICTWNIMRGVTSLSYIESEGNYFVSVSVIFRLDLLAVLVV